MSYFDTPVFSNDYTILTIPVVKGKYIIPLSSGQLSKDITVSIISSDIKDVDGFALQTVEPHTYRINQSVDTQKPEIKSILTSNTSDTSSWSYRTLTDKKIDDWSSETEYEADGATVKFLNGDYSRNHIIDTLHISLTGYDKDSGIKSVKILEVFEKTEGGTDTSKTEYETEYGNNSFIPDSNTADLYSYSFDYTFRKNASDGLYRLDICVVDKANNASDPVTCYVIKDTGLKRTISYTGYLDVPYTFENREDYDITDNCLPVFNDATGKYESKLIFKNFWLYEDTFYSSYKTQCSYFAIQKYNENNELSTIFEKKNLSKASISVLDQTKFITITEKEITGELNKALENIVIDPDVTTKFKIILWEENGIQNEVTFAVPKRPRFSGFVISEYDIDFLDEDREYSIDSETRVAITSNGIIRKKKDESNFSFYKTTYINSSPEFMFDENNCTYYISGARSAAKSLGILSQSVIYSAFGQPYVLARNDGSNGFVSGHYDECLHNPNQIENFEFPDFSFPAIESDAVEFPRSTSKVRFTLNIDSPQNGYEYLVKVMDNDSLLGVYSSKTLELDNCKKYKISLLARNSEGAIVAESSSKELCYNGPDNFPPKVEFPSMNALDKINQNRITLSMYDWDGTIPVGYSYFERKYNRIKTVECYYTSSPLGTEVTREQLINENYPVYKFSLPASKETSSLDIPVYCVESGKFYLYIYLQDIEGNDAVYSYVQQYGGYTLPIIPEFQDIHGEESIQNGYKTLFQLTFPLYTDALKPAADAYDADEGLAGGGGNFDLMVYSFSKFDSNTNKWLLNNSSGSYRIRQAYSSSNNTAECGHDDKNWTVKMRVSNTEQYINETKESFYRVGVSYGMILPDIVPVYLIPAYFFKGSDDYDYTCRNKSVMDSYNGYQVFCDKPTLAHTMFSKFKLTETSSPQDSHIWEGRGAETGIVYNDGSANTFSYTDENFEAIPSGCYYTTIFHFVDGTIIMTPVKQKQ